MMAILVYFVNFKMVQVPLPSKFSQELQISKLQEFAPSNCYCNSHANWDTTLWEVILFIHFQEAGLHSNHYPSYLIKKD